MLGACIKASVDVINLIGSLIPLPVLSTNLEAKLSPSEEIINLCPVSPLKFPIFTKLSSISQDFFQALRPKFKLEFKANKCLLAPSNSLRLFEPKANFKAAK